MNRFQKRSAGLTSAALGIAVALVAIVASVGQTGADEILYERIIGDYQAETCYSFTCSGTMANGCCGEPIPLCDDRGGSCNDPR